MRAVLVLLVAALLVIPVPAAQALHEGDSIGVGAEPSHALHSEILNLNRTIQDVEERHGSGHAAIDQAINQRALAAQALVAGNQWLTVHHLTQGFAVLERFDTWEDNRGASDQEAAYYSDMRAKWDEANDWLHTVQDDLAALQEEGVDLWLLDHALLAGSLLVKGERMHQMWAEYAPGWERGQRGDAMKNGLATAAHGPIVHAEVAKGIIDRAVENQTEEPMGPIVGTHTLRGIMESLEPLLQEGSVSLDQEFNQLILMHMSEDNWLAAMGGTVAWTENQAQASVQHAMQADEPIFQPSDVLSYLYELDGEDESIQSLEQMGIPGVSVRYSLSQAVGTVNVLQQNVENEDDTTWRNALQAASGLGALSSAHTSLAILQAANGDEPLDRIVHLPTHSPGVMELDESIVDGDEAEAGFQIPSWGWVLSLLALMAVAFLVHRSRR